MKVRFEEAYFSPDLMLIQRGIREVPDEYAEQLPKSAFIVPDDTPVTSDDDDYEEEVPVSIASLQRLTGAESQKIKVENQKMKSAITKSRNKISKLEEMVKELKTNSVSAEGE